MQKITNAIDQALAENNRVLLALAAPPAAGKSTLASKLMDNYPDAVILPMDGFYLDNRVLELKGLLARKGAPETFDAEGFVQSVKRVEKGEHVFIPDFDRAYDMARAAAIEFADQPLVIVEGNYLLFNREPWRDLAQIWTLSIWLYVSIAEIERRSVERWLSYGLEFEAATQRARGNDIRNAIFVIGNRLAAELIVTEEVNASPPPHR